MYYQQLITSYPTKSNPNLQNHPSSQLISGTSYPIKSNLAIRTELSQHPGAIYMDVSPGTNQPDPVTWFHYVECDDALHRIARLSVPRGMHMYLGSQWFAIPYHVVQWLVDDVLPFQYSLYAQVLGD